LRLLRIFRINVENSVENGEVKMEKITSRRNSLCLHVKKLGSDKDYRYANSEFICDGIKLLEEALKFDARIKTVLTSNPDLSIELPPDVSIYLVPQDILDSLSPLKNAQDVVFVCEMNDTRSVQGILTGTHFLLDGIQDPGNLGTILRSADAFEVSSVMLTGACADPYNPKTIRASMGAIFRQQILHMELDELCSLNLPILGASIAQNSIDISDVNFENTVIAIGSEGKGLSDKVLELCQQTFMIPISENCESLNAAIAASIIMWEASMQLRN